MYPRGVVVVVGMEATVEARADLRVVDATTRGDAFFVMIVGSDPSNGVRTALETFIALKADAEPSQSDPSKLQSNGQGHG